MTIEMFHRKTRRELNLSKVPDILVLFSIQGPSDCKSKSNKKEGSACGGGGSASGWGGLPTGSSASRGMPASREEGLPNSPGTDI